MEAGLSDNGKENQAVSQEGCYIEKAEGDGDPDVGSFKSRNAREDEVKGAFGGISYLGHDG